MLIRSRIIDYQRKESRHQGHLSLQEENEDQQTLLDRLPDQKDAYREAADLEATQQEIAELAMVMAQFGVGFRDVADNSPKQERTKTACLEAVSYTHLDVYKRQGCAFVPFKGLGQSVLSADFEKIPDRRNQRTQS